MLYWNGLQHLRLYFKDSKLNSNSLSMFKFSLAKIQRVTLYIYFFSLNFGVFNLYGLGSTARLTGILYLVSILPTLPLFFKTSFIKPYLKAIFLFWITLTLISFIYSNQYSRVFFDTTILLNIILFWVLVNHERKDTLVLLKGMLSFSIGSVVLTLLYNAGIGIEYQGGRVSIFGDNSNGIAVRLSIAIITLIYLTIHDIFNLKLWRLFFLLPLPVMLLFMIETGSRKAFIGFIAAFIIGTILFRSRKHWYKSILLIASGAISLYIYQLVLQSQTLYRRFLMTLEEGSLGGREDIWSTIIPLIQDNLLFGVGKTGYHEFSVAKFGSLMSPHNVLIEVLVYTGLIGFCMYFYLLLKTMWQAWLAYYKNDFLLPFLLLIPSWGLILGGQALGGKMIWAILAIAVGTVFFKNEASKKSIQHLIKTNHKK